MLPVDDGTIEPYSSSVPIPLGSAPIDTGVAVSPAYTDTEETRSAHPIPCSQYLRSGPPWDLGLWPSIPDMTATESQAQPTNILTEQYLQAAQVSRFLYIAVLSPINCFLLPG